MEEILNTGAEEQLLTNGGNKGKAEEVKQRVAVGHHSLDGKLRLLSNGAKLAFDSLPGTRPMPAVIPLGKTFYQRNRQCQNADADESKEPTARREVEPQKAAFGACIIDTDDQQCRQGEDHQLGERIPKKERALVASLVHINAAEGHLDNNRHYHKYERQQRQHQEMHQRVGCFFHVMNDRWVILL